MLFCLCLFLLGFARIYCFFRRTSEGMRTFGYPFKTGEKIIRTTDTIILFILKCPTLFMTHMKWNMSVISVMLTLRVSSVIYLLF